MLGLLDVASRCSMSCNVDEAAASSGNAYLDARSRPAPRREGAAAVVISAEDRSGDRRTATRTSAPTFLAALGLEEPGLDRVIRAGYELLGLQTYFTAGPKEVRAWTVTRGATAPQAAGVIHTDFERGFIRAETIAYDDYHRAAAASRARKDAGKMRLEGKEYVVQDGDVMHFRFAT